jgi:DNA ligase-1
VSRALVIRALASVAGIEPAIMAHRLMGEWKPSPEDFQQLLAGEREGQEPAKPYPFYLASPLEQDPAQLGDVLDWQFEWKWDGIRAQLIRRAGLSLLWSRGEEVITATFPEIIRAAEGLPPGTVLDGEILAWRGEGPRPFQDLQRRLNRRDVNEAMLRDVPVVFMAYDLLEHEGKDWRPRPLSERRRVLEKVVQDARRTFAERPVAADVPALVQGDLFAGSKDDSTEDSLAADPLRSCPLHLSELLDLGDWSALVALQNQARERSAEGVMLKLRSSPYGVGRQRGAWWKWKVAPFTCDAVLVAAQPGHGRRATLFTDYTFALWSGTELVPVAKAYSGLTVQEIDEVDAFVRGNTTGRFGPVRTVKPELVFELAFENVAASTRHKSGLALRFPRIARWRRDKRAAEADTVDILRQFIGRKAAA